MNKGIKFRIYPNKEQENLINRTLGCCRLIYNKGLAMRNDAYSNGEKIGYSQTSTMLTELKKSDDFAFLKEVDSIALQQSLRNLDRGFKNFFEKRTRHPQFKSKHISHQSYRTINQGDNIRLVGKYIKLPKLGYVKIRQSMEVGHINNVTVERAPTDKYFVVLNVDFEPELRPNAGGMIGIDVGIKEFYSDSNGNIVSNPKYLEKSMQKLVREQRKLSRKQKGSNNRNKQRIKVAKVHEKITNQRNDFLQKQSTILISENQTICIEDLNIKGMVRNHKLAQHIISCSWSKFFTMLEYKATWYGNNIIKVPTMYPSSQTCSCCGYKNSLVKNLSIRECKKIQNPRITFDGKYWYLSYSYEVEEADIVDAKRDILGIDLGIKDFAILSDGQHFGNINKQSEIKRLRKRLKRLQRQVARKYEANATVDKNGKKIFHKTNNIKKLEQQIRMIYRRISNIQKTYMYEVAKAVMKTKSQTIVIEDLNVKGMLQNPKLARSIQEENLSEFRRILTYKCEQNGMELVIADRWYPSSKTCSCCGNVKHDLKLSDRTYRCDVCGLVIDRDENAAINLEHYPKIVPKTKAA